MIERGRRRAATQTGVGRHAAIRDIAPAGPGSAVNGTADVTIRQFTAADLSWPLPERETSLSWLASRLGKNRHGADWMQNFGYASPPFREFLLLNRAMLRP
ncbi:hypothetical protein [Bradyrhizobium tunisiense]|uniref:hypothetical protein n=1 Tax=Bradyrhizobium tunisiense TaxID=3278709 RepID=UPI0035DDCF15